jgi:hypothetical protein
VTVEGDVRCWGYVAREGTSQGPEFQYSSETQRCYQEGQ